MLLLVLVLRSPGAGAIQLDVDPYTTRVRHCPCVLYVQEARLHAHAD